MEMKITQPIFGILVALTKKRTYQNDMKSTLIKCYAGLIKYIFWSLAFRDEVTMFIYVHIKVNCLISFELMWNTFKEQCKIRIFYIKVNKQRIFQLINFVPKLCN